LTTEQPFTTRIITISLVENCRSRTHFKVLPNKTKRFSFKILQITLDWMS
jgi:hypothetical protein